MGPAIPIPLAAPRRYRFPRPLASGVSSFPSPPASPGRVGGVPAPSPLLNPADLARLSADGRSKSSGRGFLLGASSPAAHAQVGHLLDGAEESVQAGQEAITRRPFKVALQSFPSTSGGPRSSAKGPLASVTGYDLLQRSFTPAELLGEL